MNYVEWAQAYRCDARRVLSVIEKKKTLLNDKDLSADERKSLADTVSVYRGIYRDLLYTAELLRKRGAAYET